MASRLYVTLGIATALACGATLMLCYAFLFGSSGNEEEFRFAILSTWLRIRGPWSLDSAFWTPLLGLGVPQPFVPNFSLHPLAPLLAWMSAIAWVRLLLVAHSIVGAVGMWRLGGAVLGFPPMVRAAVVATFLFSAPLQNYVLIDFWPSHHLVWTLLPWMLIMAWRVIDPGTSESHVRRWAGGLGLVSGVVAANANPAYLVVFIPLAVAIIVSRWRTTRRRVRWIAVAALIAGAMAAPLVVQLVTERPYFDSGLNVPNDQDPLPLQAAWIALVHPFIPDPTMGMRTLFFGAPFTALAVIGCVWFARQRRISCLAAWCPRCCSSPPGCRCRCCLSGINFATPSRCAEFCSRGWRSPGSWRSDACNGSESSPLDCSSLRSGRAPRPRSVATSHRVTTSNTTDGTRVRITVRSATPR